MAKAQVKVLPSARNTVMIVDDQSTSRAILEEVVRGLDALNDADAALSPIRQTPGGTLRVAAPMTVTLMRLSSVIPEFLSRYPDLTLDLHLDDRRVDIVREGFDLALRGSDKLEDSSLIARKLAVMPHVVCSAPSYFEVHGEPTDPTDLKSHNCIRFSLSGHADLWEFRKGSRTEKVTVKARYSVTSSLAVRDALRAGFGISLGKNKPPAGFSQMFGINAAASPERARLNYLLQFLQPHRVLLPLDHPGQFGNGHRGHKIVSGVSIYPVEVQQLCVTILFDHKLLSLSLKLF